MYRQGLYPVIDEANIVQAVEICPDAVGFSASESACNPNGDCSASYKNGTTSCTLCEVGYVGVLLTPAKS